MTIRVLQMPVTLLSLAIATAPAHADEARGKASKILPGTAISSQTPSVIDGLYEVVAGDNVLYVDASGRYLVIGSIYDLIENQDLSAARRAELRQSQDEDDTLAPLLDGLPTEAAVTTGAGARALTVIMDPDCGWCRRLWVESLRDLDGVQVRHLLPNETEQVIGILCANEPHQAFARALDVAATTAKIPVPSRDCRRAAREKVARVARFVERAGLYGTPVLIRGDGAVHRGYLGRTALLSWLEGSDEDAG